MRRIVTIALALTVLLAACGEAELSRDESVWCRAYLTPNQIAGTAYNMDIDLDQAITEAQIAYDMEALVGGDPIAQIDAFWEVMEADDGYRQVCRALHEELSTP